MNKNPFSLYDFMGYLFPGVLVLFLCAYCYKESFDIDRIVVFQNLKDVLELEAKDINVEKSFILIVVAYTIGHIIAYLSSITMEFMTNKIFGYPSRYLLYDNRKSWGTLFLNYFSSDAYSTNDILKCVKWIMKTLLKLCIMLLLLPISLSIFTIGYFFDINGFIIRPLDPYLQRTLIDKQYRLATKLGITHPDVNEDCDYHRVVMHYVYINIPNAQRKSDNYIALYGFLRSISFIMCLIFLVLAVYGIRTIEFEACVNYSYLWLLLFVFSIAYLTYLGFVKFYRRYTLENLMSLLAGLNDNNGPTCDSI